MSVLSAGAALANEAFFAAETVAAGEGAKLELAPAAAAWASMPAHVFEVHPQRTVHLHDRDANALLPMPAPLKVEVKAMSTPEGIALRFEWADDARDVIGQESNGFADSLALEVPQRYGAGQRLPAISMGDDDAWVNVTLLRAAEQGVTVNPFVGAGFGSLTRAGAPTSSQTQMVYDAKRKVWSAVAVIPKAAVKGGLVPFAFAVWNGARLERSGYKRLSSWHFVRVPKQAPDAKYVQEMSYGYNPGDLGDAAKGKALAESVCIACHRLPEKALMPEGVAPNLEAVGPLATPGYLRDSIVTPSLVVLHAPNPNQHYAPSEPRDKNGAAPNSETFLWSAKGPDGKKVSKMPPFSSFSKEQVADLVAYLKTCDGTPKEKK